MALILEYQIREYSGVKCGKPGCSCNKGGNLHCILHTDNNPSMSINTDKDGYAIGYCHSCKAGNAQLMPEFRRILHLGEAPQFTPSDTNDPLPDNAQEREPRIESGAPKKYLAYNAKFQMVGSQTRQNYTDGSKNCYWDPPLNGLSPKGLLSNLEHAAEWVLKNPDAEILIPEGPKLAALVGKQAVLENLPIFPAGTFGSSGSISEDMAESLVKLKPKGIILATDADDTGRQFMLRNAEVLAAEVERTKSTTQIRLLGAASYAQNKGEDLEQALFDYGKTLKELVDGAQIYDPHNLPLEFVSIEARAIDERSEASQEQGVEAEVVFDLASLVFNAAERFDQMDFTKPEYVLRPFVAEGTITNISGFHKFSGKSTWIASWVDAIVNGKPWGDLPPRPLVPPRDVVWLTEERESLFVPLLKRARIHNHPRLHYLNWDRLLINYPGVPWPMICKQAAEFAAGLGAVLIFDTLDPYTFVPGDQSNQTGTAREVMQHLVVASSPEGHNLPIVITRHENKGSKDGGRLGFSALNSGQYEAQSDILFRISSPNAKPFKPGEEIEPEASYRIVECVSRLDPHVPYMQTLQVDAATDEDPWTADRWTLGAWKKNPGDSKEHACRSELLRLIPDDPDKAMTNKEIYEHGYMKDKFSEKMIDKILKVLWKDQGMIQRAGEGKNQHTPFVWWRPSKFKA